MILFEKEVVTDLGQIPVKVVVETRDFRRPDLIEQGIGEPEMKTDVQIKAFIDGDWRNVQANILELLNLE